MPIDIDQLKFLVKSAGQVPDKATQAMAAAAQTAKPAGGIPLPKELKEESPAQGVLSAEQQQREQEKLEQQRRKELESKENEIRGLKHELELERVEREKMTNQHALDEKVRQEEAKLKAERDKLEQDRFQLVQEKARQDNMFKAEEMRHQATLDKATYKQEAEIAKAQAKSMSDIAKQQAQTLIANNDKARKASDKYYADASARLNKEHPSISPALQSQLDGAIASLGRFSKVHKKQVAIPKPGTPPDLTKLAMIKWAADENPTGAPASNTPTTGSTQTAPTPSASTGSGSAPSAPFKRGGFTQEEHLANIAADRRKRLERMDRENMTRELMSRGAYETGSAYDAQRAAAYYSNQYARAKAENDQMGMKQYKALMDKATNLAQKNLNYSAEDKLNRKSDIASYKSYTDKRLTFNGLSSHKAYSTTESQYDRDANAYNDAQAAYKHQLNGGAKWYHKLYDYTVGGIVDGAVNSVSDALASSRNAGYFGANRFWNTTFDDPNMSAAYRNSINNHNYSDSVSKDWALAAANVGAAALTVTGAAGLAGGLARGTLVNGARAAMGNIASNGVRGAAKNALNAGWQSFKAAPIRTAVGGTLNGAGRTMAAYDAVTLPGRVMSSEIPQSSYLAANPNNLPTVKFASVAIPVPGEKPSIVKQANVNLLTAQTSNDYYDSLGLSNESYYKPMYSPLGKTISGLISNFTGGLINPYKAVSKYDIYRAPVSPTSSRALMNRVVNEADNRGNSNIHKVVANAAEEKHSPKHWGNTNGTLRHSSVSGRIFNNQLSQAML